MLYEKEAGGTNDEFVASAEQVVGENGQKVSDKLPLTVGKTGGEIVWHHARQS